MRALRIGVDADVISVADSAINVYAQYIWYREILALDCDHGA